jgi:guanylate kinase
MIDNNELIEYAKYVNNYYGTPKAYVESQLEAGKNVILEIEIQGALNIKKIYPEAVLIFITPPSAKELENRLRGRNTEDEATILARLSRAYDESEGLSNYDYVVINDKVEDCVERIVGIVSSEKMKINNNIELINKVREELKAYSKGEQ